jgi:hypothetical protein
MYEGPRREWQRRTCAKLGELEMILEDARKEQKAKN